MSKMILMTVTAFALGSLGNVQAQMILDNNGNVTGQIYDNNR
jgi:hypothetical protein